MEVVDESYCVVRESRLLLRVLRVLDDAKQLELVEHMLALFEEDYWVHPSRGVEHFFLNSHDSEDLHCFEENHEECFLFCRGVFDTSLEIFEVIHWRLSRYSRGGDYTAVSSDGVTAGYRWVFVREMNLSLVLY